MKKSAWLLLWVVSAWSATAGSADTGARTYADPACSARDVDPEKCVLRDEPQPQPRAIAAGKTTSGSGGGGTPPATGPTRAASFGSNPGSKGGLSTGGGKK